MRDFLLENSRAIVQDDSGIPLSVLRARDWQVMYFGNYTTPLDIFAKHDQPDLRAAYASGAGFSLPFGFGYRWQRGEYIIPNAFDPRLISTLPPAVAPRALPANPSGY